MKISYAIPVCNEHVEIQRLVSFLLKYKEHTDEIVIFFDSNNGSKSVEEYIRSHSVNGEFTWHPYPFDGHFGNMKNKLSEMCDWYPRLMPFDRILVGMKCTFWAGAGAVRSPLNTCWKVSRKG